jgi:glycerate kinase
MTIAVVPDKYKGCLSSVQVAEAIVAGVLEVNPSAICHRFYASDGGDGFLETIRRYIPGSHTVEVSSADAYGNGISSCYLWCDNTRTAYVELAETVGLAKLDSSYRALSEATTRGMGKQIAHALDKGAKRVVMGLGGSATNDAGMGILAELGFAFLDEYGEAVDPVPYNFKKISTLIPPSERIGGIEFIAINDVNNPLLGPTGATYTYARQKGATENELPELESNLNHLTHLDGLNDAVRVARTPGSGAAGGTAFGLMAGLGARFEAGALFLLELSGFEQFLESGAVDLVLTGEGKMDQQTTHGKLIDGVIELARQHQVPVMAICGKVEGVGAEDLGLLDLAQISDPNKPPTYSFDHASELIERHTADLLRLHGQALIRQ